MKRGAGRAQAINDFGNNVISQALHRCIIRYWFKKLPPASSAASYGLVEVSGSISSVVNIQILTAEIEFDLSMTSQK